MENGTWNNFLNKHIKVIIDDTNYPKKKEGILKDISETHLFLEIGNKIEIILKTKILRAEILKDEN